MANAKVRKLLADLPAFRSLSLEYSPGADNVAELADRLGRVAAVRAELVAYEDALKEVIREHGAAAIEGRLFRATLSSYEQTRLDTKGIREAKQPPVVKRWLNRFWITSAVIAVKVHPRLGIGLEEKAA